MPPQSGSALPPRSGSASTPRSRAAPPPRSGTALPPLSVDRTSPVPLYFQLARQLEGAVEDGTLVPGTLLGNEIDLAARLGLSRPTVRQALRTLVDKGLLVRRRGVGTQVVHTGVRRPPELSSLYDDLESAGRHPATRVLANRLEPATGPVAAALGVPEGSEVHYLERLRTADGEPLARLRDHLPAGLLEPDTALLEATGLHRLLRSAAITLHSARQAVGARAATAAEAALLDEEEGAPLLTMERVTYDDTGRAVAYGSHLYRAARHSFEFRLMARP